MPLVKAKMATVRWTFSSMAYLFVVGLALHQAAAASPSVAATPPTPTPGLWLLIHAGARCQENTAEAKDLGDSNILGCQARTLADAECGNQMFGDGVSCKCVRMGRVCDLVASSAGTDGVYEYRLVGSAHARAPEISSPWWTAQRPSEDQMQCLKSYQAGCRAVRQEVGCLSGRDGRSLARSTSTPEANTLPGGPCVWCGGGLCSSGSDAMCEPFDYLMNGEGKDFKLFLAKGTFRVAACKGDTPHPAMLALPSNLAYVPTSAPLSAALQAEQIMLFPHKPKSVDCLDFYDAGCFSIKDKQTCVNRRDGQSTLSWNGIKIHGEPCVWCGPSCVWACEPFEFLMRGEGMAFVAMRALKNLTVANCKQGEPHPVTLKELVNDTKDQDHLVPGSSALKPWWIQRRPTEEQIQCLDYHPVGCGQIRDMGTCLRSRDGRSLRTVHGLKIQGEPCVWCGGGACHSHSKNLCEPYDYLMWGEGRVFSQFYAKGFYRVASCDAPIKLPLPKLDCLVPHAQGCSAITNKHTCLESTDGRQLESVHGLKIRGQPCVWCGGGVCHTNKFTLCEPLDYLVNGEGRVFMTFIAKLTSSVAACKGNNPHAAMLAGWFAPTWPHVASPKLVPGSECINFPACVEIGLRFGSCCPDFAGTTLPCCTRSQGVRAIAVPTMPPLPLAEVLGHLPFKLPQKPIHMPGVQLPTLPVQLPKFPAKQPPQQPQQRQQQQQQQRQQQQQQQMDLKSLVLTPNPVLPFHQSSSDSHRDSAVDPSAITTTRVRAVTLPAHLAPAVTLPAHLAPEPAPPALLPPSLTPGLRHKGEDCYASCKQRTGFCNWCGAGNACCVYDEENGPVECSGIKDFETSHYECVVPVISAGATDSSSRRPAVVAPSVTRKPELIVPGMTVHERSGGTASISDAVTTRPVQPAGPVTHQRNLPLGVEQLGSTTLKLEKQGSTTLKVEKRKEVVEEKEEKDRDAGGGSFPGWMMVLIFLCCCMFCMCAAGAWYMGMSETRKKKTCDMISRQFVSDRKKKRKAQETDEESSSADEDGLHETSSSEALLLDCNVGLDRLKRNRNSPAAGERALTGGLPAPAGAISEPMAQQQQLGQQRNHHTQQEQMMQQQQQQQQQLQPHPISRPGSPQQQQRQQQEQMQYDLVTITPDGPKVVSLAGASPPPGIPIATKPYDLITMPQNGAQSPPGSGLSPPVVPTPPLQHSYVPKPGGSLRAPTGGSFGPQAGSIRAPSMAEGYEMVTVTPQGLQVQPMEGIIPPGMPVMNVQRTPAPAPQQPEGPLILV